MVRQRKNENLPDHIRKAEERIENFERKFNFIHMFNRIHTSPAVDPQGVEVFNKTIWYSFLLRGPVDEYGRQEHFSSGSSKGHIDDVVKGFASALRTMYPELYIKINPQDRKNYQTEIKIQYTVKRKRELGEILTYLRTIPIEGGKLPKKDATSFCYD